MFARAQEKHMRVVRGLLACAWVLIIISLFWDPFTPDLTRPDNLASPFHLRYSSVLVQGQAVPQTPYAMGNRIFWTMIIPLVPLFLMIFGHEAWRRICPLSFLSQIPRYLGIQRRKATLIRQTGQIERQLALVKRDGWLKNNVWYVQFGLLFLALTARLLLVNSDRIALAVMLIAIIVAAVSIGYFWGGKTWCNYVCPIGIVQKIYTEPRGLLESRPHLQKQSITQSMCRTSTEQGERSICVGCTSNCPDIDLERSYWENIANPSVRNVYYGFFGLVLGFYFFFYLYAGNWDYYFTGAWTHEDDIYQRLLGPGLYLFGHAIPIPKLISVPLVLAIFVGLAWWFGQAAEKLYRRFLQRQQSTLSEAEIMNRCLSFCAFLTLNVFYIFGGRSNLNLLPPMYLRLVDFIIVAASVLWFFQAIQRSPVRYRRESLARSLMEQLRNMKIDISRYVETSNIEQLSADEVYVLAKTLPSFSTEQRVIAYRNILSEAIRTGRVDAASSGDRMRELRQELGVTDDQHRAVLEECGFDAQFNQNADAETGFEQWLRKDNYRLAIEPVIVSEMEKGAPFLEVLAREEIAVLIKNARELYQISSEEHQLVLDEIGGQKGILFQRASQQLKRLSELAVQRMVLQTEVPQENDWRAIQSICDSVLRRRSAAMLPRLFSILRTFGNSEEARWIAHGMAIFSGDQLAQALTQKIASDSNLQYHEVLHPRLLEILGGDAVYEAASSQSQLQNLSLPALMQQAEGLLQVLVSLAQDEDPLLCAVALTGISYLDQVSAKQCAEQLRGMADNEALLHESVANVLGLPRRSLSSQGITGIRLGLRRPNQADHFVDLEKDYITLGRDSSNDCVIVHPSLSAFHACIQRDGEHTYLLKRDPFVSLTLDGEPVKLERTLLKNGSVIGFQAQGQLGPSLSVEWHENQSHYRQEHCDGMTRLLWLSSVGLFRGLDLRTIAQMAEAAEVRVYAQDTYVCRSGEPSSDAYLLQSGEAEVVLESATEVKVLKRLQAGAIVGELGVITNKPRTASVRICSSNARIVTINGDCLHKLMRQDPAVSMSMLNIVAHYIQN